MSKDTNTLSLSCIATQSVHTKLTLWVLKKNNNSFFVYLSEEIKKGLR
jgi:hypothetical protein